MNFDLNQALAILRRTPDVLETLLKDLPEPWTMQNEGGKSWSPYDVIGHLIHGEKTDWIDRTKIVLFEGPDKTFTPFDRFAQFQESQGKSLNQLLAEFRTLRLANLKTLEGFKITADMLDKTAMHPSLGKVTLRNLLATWTAHDLNHIYQIVRVMAKHYKTEVGPWSQYLRLVNE
ncbi:MAG TPA: DinB family protein [candidate division Zixibacteria bacterium]|nr:DinB family protein [candidate division Zixibacteria bacterium]